MTRQQAIMKKGIMIFKHNSRLKFSRFKTTALHKCDPIISLTNTPLRTSREIGIYAYKSVTGISLVIMT